MLSIRIRFVIARFGYIRDLYNPRSHSYYLIPFYPSCFILSGFIPARFNCCFDLTRSRCHPSAWSVTREPVIV